jgi:cold-inducible RNA-binding protein
MSSKIYVGNLPYSVDDASLRHNFSEYGTVSSAKVMMDRDTGRSKGFGFVEMSSDAEAQAAINGMNGQALDGRALVVNEARPKEDRGDAGGYRGGNSDGYRGGRSSY